MADIIQKIRDDITVESVLMTVIKMPGVKIKEMSFFVRNCISIAPKKKSN